MIGRVGCLAALMTILAVPGRGAETASTGTQRVAWLQGCWQRTSAEQTVDEQWMAPEGRAMVGMSRTVRRGEMIEYELVVVREHGERLVYVAHPSGQDSAEFVSTEISEQRVVFESAGHDFPQRIGYERDDERLTAWIEGTRNGQLRRIEFPYQRVTCP